MPNGQVTTLSGRKEPIKIGLLKAMLRKSGISEAQFVGLMKKGLGTMGEYIIVIHAAEEDGYWAELPALGGCYVQGESIDEILGDAPDAIASHLEALNAFGESPGRSESITIATVRVPPAA
jgi:predicted RNase H-like HicB family nuclease